MARGPQEKLLRVARDHVVVLDYVLYDEAGDVVEETDEEGGAPVRCVYGYGTLVPGLERGLIGMAPGETREIVVTPEEGYGAVREELERWVDRADFPEDVAIDDEFDAEDEDGTPHTLRVAEITDDAILVDENHPLAGVKLRFDVIVREVRPATEAELAAARKDAPPARLLVLNTTPEPPSKAPPLKPAHAGVRDQPRGKRPKRPDPLDDEQ